MLSLFGKSSGACDSCFLYMCYIGSRHISVPVDSKSADLISCGLKAFEKNFTKFQKTKLVLSVYG